MKYDPDNPNLQRNDDNREQLLEELNSDSGFWDRDIFIEFLESLVKRLKERGADEIDCCQFCPSMLIEGKEFLFGQATGEMVLFANWRWGDAERLSDTTSGTGTAQED